MGEPSLAPSRRRIEQAREAGFRPRSRFIETGLGALGLALLVRFGGPWLADAWTTLLRQPMVEPGGTLAVFSPFVWGFGFVALVFAAAATAVATFTAQWGRVRARALAHPPARSSVSVPAVVAIALVAVGIAGAGFMLHPVLAGSARGADASQAGLAVLWWTWAWRAPATLGIIVLGLGTMELAFARARLWRALHLDKQTARDLAKARR